MLIKNVASYVAKLALLLVVSTLSSGAHAQVTLNLTTGWSLLGNSSAAFIDVAATFKDATKITTVWKWNTAGSKWAFYAPSMTPSALATYAQGKGYDVLTSIASKEGFWVNASTAVALTGPAASGVTLVASDLQPSWNLVGSADNKTPSQLNQALGSSLNAAGKVIVTAWAWDAPSANWKFFAPALEAQGGTALADYITSKGYLTFSTALSAADGFWLNVGVATTTTTTAQATTTTTAAATTTTTAPTTTTTTAQVTTTTTPVTTTTTTTATTTTTTLRVSATNFTAAAMAGELLTYTLDTSALTYSYKITESQYGLTGISRSGTLTNNGDGTYTPSGVNNGTVATLPNGLLLTSIYETVGGIPATIPVMGISNPVTTLSNTTFNYIQRVCYYYSSYSYSCESGYGTFQLTTAGTWASCPLGNLTTGCPGGSYSGTVNSLGGGMWQVWDATGFNIGTAVVLSSAGQQVVFLDLKDARVSNYASGVGLLVGSTQQAPTTAQSNGTWVVAGSNGDSVEYLVSGTNASCLIRNGAACGDATTLTFNYPWTGLAATSSGGYVTGVALLAGTGMYALAGSGDYVEIGIKLK
jgi:hypothetical protein